MGRLHQRWDRISNIAIPLAVAALAILLGGVAIAGDLPPGGTFTDDNGNVHESSIEAIAAAGITKGCNPPVGDLYCPGSSITRGQMAAFLVRALGLTDKGDGDLFEDDDASIFESDIDKIAVAGITKGCNPPDNNKFCPDRHVTRGEIAALLVRTLALVDGAGDDLFDDDDGSIFELDIDRLGTAGVTKGCNPPFNTRYCPSDEVRRDQMATLLTRAFELTPIDPPPPTEGDQGSPVPPTDFKVAFIGDQGSGSDARAVLELIRDEGSDMVLHQGDFDYRGDPTAWDDLITDVLGADFPYFASVGNHDKEDWSGYQTKLSERLSRVPGATCTGDLGVRSSCTFNQLFLILSGAGTLGSDHEAYIEDQLAQTEYPWRICSWHKNMEFMQVGGKGDSTGWGVYEACRLGAALIATGHEHNYSRTKTLIDMESQIVDNPPWDKPDEVRVARGATFAFVSGLGGHSIRGQQRCKPASPPYGCNGEWAHIYTTAQDAAFGALFCSFNVGGRADVAECYFRDVDGNTPDRFTITNFLVGEA